MREHKNFWDRNADLYDRFMQKDRAVYEKMYVLICPVVKNKTVLELATGTGLIAKHIVNAAAQRPNGGITLRSCTFRYRICFACPMRTSLLMW